MGVRFDRWAWVLALALLTGGCSLFMGDPEFRPCKGEELLCPDGMACIGGVCQIFDAPDAGPPDECTVDADCADVCPDLLGVGGEPVSSPRCDTDAAPKTCNCITLSGQLGSLTQEAETGTITTVGGTISTYRCAQPVNNFRLCGGIVQ